MGTMKTFAKWIFLLLFCPMVFGQHTKEIKVKTNANFELLAIAYLMLNYEDFAGIPDDQTVVIDGKTTKVKDLYRLNLLVADAFKPHLKSPHLQTIKAYLDKDFYLHYSNFVMSLNAFPDASVGDDNPFVKQFSSVADARKFTDAFNQFYLEISFDSYLEKFRRYYDQMIREVNSNLPKENFIGAMENFYGKSMNSYVLYPSLAMPFSQGFAVGNSDSTGFVFGSFNVPDLSAEPEKLGFDNMVFLRNLCIHEFGHSFVNPAIDKVEASVISKSEHLFEPIKEKMAAQAYNSWKICLYEHFVRAGEVLIAKNLEDLKTARKILDENTREKSFIYLPKIVSKLAKWQKSEADSKTYEQIVSEIIGELK